MHDELSAATTAMGTVLCAVVLWVGCQHKASPTEQRNGEPSQAVRSKADSGTRPGSMGASSLPAPSGPSSDDSSLPRASVPAGTPGDANESGPPEDDLAAASFHKSLPFESIPVLLPQPVPEPALGDGRFAAPETSSPLPKDTQIVLGSEVVQSTRDPNRKGTLVNVWATWCGSCQVEMPMLLKLGKHYAAKGIEVLFVSVDEPNAAAKVEASLRERGVAGATFIAHPELGYFKRALSPIWKGVLPATFLYDSEGRLRYFWGAQAMENEVVPIVEGLLQGKPIDGMANYSVTVGAAH